jgi:type IV pilus assembly protein PilY1
VTADESARIWVFFGTGRFFGTNDKSNTDTQYLYGVKDPVVSGTCTQSTTTNCEKKNIVNVSNAVVCVVCAGGTSQVTGVTGVDGFSGTATNTLEGLVQSMDGWYTTLPTSKERALSQPTLLGGTVFYTSFVPNADICSASGDGMIYALFYKTGSAYKESVIGTYTSGSNTNVSRSIGLGIGLPSQMAVQIGSQGDGTNGQVAGSGCAGRVTGFIQASTGALNQFCGKPALSSWSRYVSWLNKRI